LAAAGFGVATAFADMAKQDALAGAYQEVSADAARAAGGNPGPAWETLLEAPAGRRSLALWFDTIRSQWPSACSDGMAKVSQSSAACLPDSGFLQALIDARLGPQSYQALADNAAATALERAAVAQPIAAPEPAVMDRDVAAGDTAVERAAEALRAESDHAELEAFLGAYEPSPAPVTVSVPPTPATGPIEALEAPVLETSPVIEESALLYLF
jgi:hypothetical protein